MSDPDKAFRRMLTWNTDQVAFCEMPLKQKCCFEVPVTRLLQDVLRVGIVSKGCLTTDLPDIAEGFLPLSGFVGEGNFSIINSTQWCQLYVKTFFLLVFRIRPLPYGECTDPLVTGGGESFPAAVPTRAGSLAEPACLR